jgi:SOS-response transcriptional repressor LexA
MSTSYEMTGFQSPCAEFAEKPLSLDERYLIHHSAIFIIQAVGESKALGIKSKDRLIIDRSLTPKEGQLILLVINNQFEVGLYSKKMLEGQDPESGDFIWGVVTTLLREFV